MSQAEIEAGTTTTTICTYEHLKIYQVDLIDGQLKKFTLVKKDGDENNNVGVGGCLTIYLDERHNQVYIVINSDKHVYDQLRLNEIDLDLVKSGINSHPGSIVRFGRGGGGDGDTESSGVKVEFRKRTRDKKNIIIYYAVEFSSRKILDDLSKTFDHLIEAYSINTTKLNIQPRVDQVAVRLNFDGDDDIEIIEEKESVEELARNLTACIRNGDAENAVRWARRLANVKAHVEINIRNDMDNREVEKEEENNVKTTNSDVSNDNDQKLVKFELKLSFSFSRLNFLINSLVILKLRSYIQTSN